MIEIAGYADIVQIGHGGLGDVYRATRRSTGGTVAIKVLRDVSDESVAWHRTRRELTALVALAGHANVIQLLELLELEQGPALVMEYAPGGSIADLVRRRDGTLSVAETVLVGRHTAAALVAAHEQGIVHRDIKPQNLLIDAYGQVKLCDFGIAALTRTDDFRARTSALSMRYASPEDLDDEIEVGPPSDVYSLGATLLHLARGAPPTLKERLAPWEPPPSDDADQAALDAVIAGCLQPDAAARPTAAALLDELERLGWSVDERQRALAFDPPDSAGGLGGEGSADGDVPTDERTTAGRAGSADGASERASTAGDRPLAGAAAAVPAEDPTVQRPWPADPDDATASRPAPPARPTRRRTTSRRPWIVVGGLVVAAAVAGFVLWPSGDDDGPIAAPTAPATSSPATTAPTTTTAPPTTTAPTTEPTISTAATISTAPPAGDTSIELVERPAELVDVMELEWPPGALGECLVQADLELAPVDCAEPHDLQRVGIGEVAEADFDRDIVLDSARSACADEFASFVGIEAAASRLELAVTIPTAAAWGDGDRAYRCYAFVPGRRVVGDVADAAF